MQGVLVARMVLRRRQQHSAVCERLQRLQQVHCVVSGRNTANHGVGGRSVTMVDHPA
jgi:hypothetical protein